MRSGDELKEAFGSDMLDHCSEVVGRVARKVPEFIERGPGRRKRG